MKLRSIARSSRMSVGISSRIKSSLLIECLRLLSLNDRRKMIIVVLLQILMSLLDLIGIAAIGALGAISVVGLTSHQPGLRVSKFMEVIGISDLNFQTQAMILGVSAACILTVRTVFSILITRKSLRFLSNRSAQISNELVKKILNLSLSDIQKRSTQQILYSVTNGVTITTLGVIGTLVVVIGDLSLLVVISTGLFILDKMTALLLFAFFGLIGLVLYRFMHKKAAELGQLNSDLSIEGDEKIVEVLGSYRELLTRNRRYFYINKIDEVRHMLSSVLAEIQFMPSISKYVIELSVVVGAVAIGAIQFSLTSASRAIATITVFLAAGTRLAPAVMRFQQGLITIKTSLGLVAPTLNYVRELENTVPLQAPANNLDFTHKGFEPAARVQSVSAKYPNSESLALTNTTLEISKGTFVAIVGPSGGGKTTFVDVLLGVLKPVSGLVLLSGVDPLQAYERWPGAVAYVPQDVMISNTTILENVALGFSSEEISEERVWQALDQAELSEVVRNLPNGLQTIVGERGSKLSGGQRQRLGIARALFTKPKFLVLDEATSALDGQTESMISNSISKLKGQLTLVVVAHRLSTVRNADQVLYLEKGQVIAKGTFDEVRQLVPEFENQAKMMGL